MYQGTRLVVLEMFAEHLLPQYKKRLLEELQREVFRTTFDAYCKSRGVEAEAQDARYKAFMEVMQDALVVKVLKKEQEVLVNLDFLNFGDPPWTLFEVLNAAEWGAPDVRQLGLRRKISQEFITGFQRHWAEFVDEFSKELNAMVEGQVLTPTEGR